MIRKVFIMLCLFIGAFYLTACSTEDVAKNTEMGENESEVKESEAIEQQAKVETGLEDQEDECVEPPQVIIVDTYEEIHALKDLIDEPDEMAVQEYLDKAYDIDTGLDSKADIICFFEKIEALEMPYLEVNDIWKLEWIEYSVEFDMLELAYSGGKEMIRFIGTSKEPNNFSKECSGENKVPVQIGDKEVNLRFSSEEKPWVIGKIQTSNSYVIMRYRAEDKERIEDKMAVADIKIAPMGKVIEKIMEKEYWAED